MKKLTVSMQELEQVHPYLPQACQQLEQGRISRREFLRTATLLGLSAGTAMVAAGCGAAATPPPTATP
ncbi:MAG TPA: hypothetical protein P5526_19250, partial [Anaerolineae bacterium]|nr:hypothetical protein [Anaerolineae bacterium]